MYWVLAWLMARFNFLLTCFSPQQILWKTPFFIIKGSFEVFGQPEFVIKEYSDLLCRNYRFNTECNLFWYREPFLI